MRRMIRPWLSLSLLALSPIASTRADTLDDRIETAFAPLVSRYDVPGLVIGVTQDGVHHFYATGLASRADKRPVTPDTLFELGSMSKIFTATLAALAVERGKMALGDTVAHHLCNDQCRIGNDLTLLDLATHHSGGLPLQVPETIHDINGLIAWLKTWQPPEPGARSYSNVSIGLLGFISGQSLGLPYAEAAQTILFPALNLHHTWIQVPHDDMGHYAYGYDRKTDAAIRVHPGVLADEAYGVKSTARDMLALLDVELGLGHPPAEIGRAVALTQKGRFLTAFFTQDMIWEHYPWPTPLQPMMLGNGYDFILKPQPVKVLSLDTPQNNAVIFNKTGSTDGFGGYIVMIPSRRIGIIMLANRNTPNEARVQATYTLLRALLRK
ncbi:class C beta-lactamase [Asaia krungthepensis]|uniref:Beta-lactamase n=1 Tax=Asaia krungthepensis NRIC 0535 TaxID=1307925 RepID=A0ABQ0Q0I3_9PROT|nr:class C beta-lactamase [Asaia krungthepensis]GBQ86151.1 beta-lactamase class C [Asaia krungthepensis NRIC 0535]